MTFNFCVLFSIASFMTTVIKIQSMDEHLFFNNGDNIEQYDLDRARVMRDASSNSYAKKFSSKRDAENYIKDFSFEIVNSIKKPNNNAGFKRPSTLKPPSSLRDHIQNIKMAFNNLQEAIATFSGLTTTHADRIKVMNEEIYCKLHEILGVNLTEIEEDACLAMKEKRARLLHESELFLKNKNTLSSKFDCSDVTKLSQKSTGIAKEQFIMNENNEVVVFTDGACSKNGQVGAMAGAGVWFGYGNPLNLALKVPGKQTNNNAEIFSTIRAIEQVKSAGMSRVNIHTDSNFVIQSINDWMPRWKTCGWKTKTGNPIKNREMFEKLDQCIQSMESVSWTYVPGHVGIAGNEEADKLAKIGAIK